MALNSIPALLLWLATWPYHWTLCHHTIKPIRLISSCNADIRRLRRALELFIKHKDKELRFVMTASTLSAAANLASLQWPISRESPWAAPALWYCSLLLAIFALILAAQQAVLLELLTIPSNSSKEHPSRRLGANRSSVDKNEEKLLENTLRLFVCRRRQTGGGSNTTNRTTSIVDNAGSTGFKEAIIVESQPTLVTRGTTSPSTISCTNSRAATSNTLVGGGGDCSDSPLPLHSGVPDFNMMYIWQAPLMLMSWSWVSYMVGLTLWVASPLWPQIRYQDDRKVAVFFIACCTTICVNFGWCSFWAYRAAAPAHSHPLDDDACLHDKSLEEL